jgi:hypothetical protein
VAAAAASSRLLFFLAVFADLDGEGFILQVHDVFTCIRSGAYSGISGWRRAWIYCGGGVRWKWIWPRSIRNGSSSEGWKTLKVLASIYKSNRLRNGRKDKSTLG